MRNRLLPLLALFATLRVAAAIEPAPMPAFTHTGAQEWLNSPPLTWNDLRGKVVLIDVWTFDCWNCYRTIPWIKSLEERFGDERFVVLGVHTPELPQEYVLANVRKKVAEFGVKHPVMIDNDYSYWKALGNRYWPAFYVVDASGRLRGIGAGETHVGQPQALEIERQIESLLREAGEKSPSP
jgi:thiol-disulfide isomerase/thioredoxin